MKNENERKCVNLFRFAARLTAGAGLPHSLLTMCSPGHHPVAPARLHSSSPLAAGDVTQSPRISLLCLQYTYKWSLFVTARRVPIGCC